MSTVDSAIINTISEIKAQSGGTILTSGDGINITNGTINVKYNSNTMELVDGALSAKNGGGSGGVSYTAGDAIYLANNKISVLYDGDTMTLKNGKLSAKTSSSGGNVPTEDVLEHPLPQSGMFDAKNYYRILDSSDLKRARTGDIIRLPNSRDEIKSFILVMKTDTLDHEVPMSVDNPNAIIIAEDGTTYPVRVYIDDFAEAIGFAIPFKSGEYKDLEVNPELGLFLNKQMSYNTICTILRYSTGVN